MLFKKVKRYVSCIRMTGIRHWSSIQNRNDAICGDSSGNRLHQEIGENRYRPVSPIFHVNYNYLETVYRRFYIYDVSENVSFWELHYQYIFYIRLSSRCNLCISITVFLKSRMTVTHSNFTRVSRSTTLISRRRYSDISLKY